MVDAQGTTLAHFQGRGCSHLRQLGSDLKEVRLGDDVERRVSERNGALRRKLCMPAWCTCKHGMRSTAAKGWACSAHAACAAAEALTWLVGVHGYPRVLGCRGGHSGRVGLLTCRWPQPGRRTAEHRQRQHHQPAWQIPSNHSMSAGAHEAVCLQGQARPEVAKKQTRR